MYAKDVSEHKEPLALGGWLILLAIGIIISPFTMVYALWTTYSPIFTEGIWQTITTEGTEAYSPYWQPIIISEITANVLLTTVTVYVAYLFFTKKAVFPKWYFALVLSSATLILLSSYAATIVMPNLELFDSGTLRELARSLIGVFVWAPYLFFSQRAKDTFVVRHN